MGVPKFYRWISERYPCLSEVVQELQIPEFDNLYLDMNGVVHVCSHPEDDNPHFRITEAQIFKDICHYIEFLFRMIKPKKVFFMAIDGVAPRAKMNQQRGRRFRSAREADELIKKALEKGEVLPTEKRFDSNCITPGTPFMVSLQNHLKYFVVEKVTHDPLWQGTKIILSGHETPGEGEHKVMDFIRYTRSQPGYNPNTRHCLYGLDADLIMLGLASHEPRFALLREEVRFNKDKTKRPTTPEETTFHLLHLSLMREYLDYEFSALKDTLPFPYNLERVIDDWILMGFLVGNDFVPHLPSLHIHHDALPLLWRKYMEILPTLGGYLNEGGHLNLPRFEKYLGTLADVDRDEFRNQFVDMKYFAAKRGGRSSNRGSGAGASVPRNGLHRQKPGTDNSFAALQGLDNMDNEYDQNGQHSEQVQAILASVYHDLSEEDDPEDDTFEDEFQAHKRDYYMSKLELKSITPEMMRDQTYQYIRALQWILLYYYEGVQSWSWYYPQHYAPFVSDLNGFADMVLNYQMSEPFKPFEQLMAVLPSASKELLPAPLQELMTSQNSPVIDYYPEKFLTDLNGKQQDWEAVVLIPFIDENRLLSAMHAREHLLTPEERARNTHGPCYMYQFTPEHQGTYPSSLPGVFPDIAASHAKVVNIPMLHFCLEPDKIHKGLLPGSRLDHYFPGFPTLKHIAHEHHLQKAGVKVFQMNSRGLNMMLKINDLPERDLGSIADELLGQMTWVGWPHLHEAKVYAVADEKSRIELVEKHEKGLAEPLVSWNKKDHNREGLDVVKRDASSIKEKYHDRFGVEVGKTTVVIYAGRLTGKKYACSSGGEVAVVKQFSTYRIPFVLQATCKDVIVNAPDDTQIHTMAELFPADAPVFMLGHPNYGCQGKVLTVDNTEVRVRASFKVPQEPDLSPARVAHADNADLYMPGPVAAQRVGIGNHFLSRITGTVLIMRGDGNSESRANIGLNLKFTKRGEEVPGYTKKTDNGWRYSEKCVEVIQSYLAEFPGVMKCLASKHGGDNHTEVELFPEESGETLKGLLNFREDLACAKVKPMKFGADIVGGACMLAIDRAVNEAAELNSKERCVTMQVRPQLLFRPLPNQYGLEPDPSMTLEILDRVVVVKTNYTVPLGLRGTIIGVYKEEDPTRTMFDVFFDREFEGGILLSQASATLGKDAEKRGYRVPPVAVINLTHGERKKPGHQKQPQAQASKNPWKQASDYGYQGSRQGQGQGQGSYSALMRRDGQQGSGAGGYGEGTAQRQGQRSGFSNNFGLYSQPQGQGQQPQFVTPKFATSPPKASKGPPSSGPSMSGADNSNFTMIWNQLSAAKPTKTSGPSASTTTTTTKKKVLSSTSLNTTGFPHTSLQSAAEKLGKIAPPPFAAGEEEDLEPPTGILVDLSEEVPSSSVQDRLQLEPSPRDDHFAKKEPPREGTARAKVEGPKTEARHVTAGPAEQKGRGGRSVLQLFANAAKAKDAQSKSPSSGSDTHSAKEKAQVMLYHQVATAALSSGDGSRETESGRGEKAHSKSPSGQPGSSKAQQGEAVPFDMVQAMFQQAQQAEAAPVDMVQAMFQQAQQGEAAPVDMVQAMFLQAQQQQQQQAATASNESASSASGAASDLNALFAALQIAPKSASSSVQQSSEDGSAALKQMLKIRVEDPPSSESASKNNYGRQVSVQELFDGAKQTAPASKEEPAPTLLQQQQSVRPPLTHPLLPPPALLTTPGAQNAPRNRSRVDELSVLCQLAGQPLPKYDFNFQPRQKGFISLVTIPGGARFEGSLSPSREEAAESAASMAMLCVQQAQMRFPGQQWRPSMQRPGPGMGAIRPGQQLFSPNSAFSPVSNPLMRFRPPLFNQPPPMAPFTSGPRGRQPLLSQPPPPFPTSVGPQTSSQPLAASANRPPYSQAPHVPVSSQSQHRPSNQSSSPSEAWNSGNQAQLAPSCRDGEAAAASVTKSSTETFSFVPMQVTRKQRRKEETPEKQQQHHHQQQTSWARSADSTDSRKQHSQPSQVTSSSTPREGQMSHSKPLFDSDSVQTNYPQGKGVAKGSSGGGGQQRKSSTPNKEKNSVPAAAATTTPAKEGRGRKPRMAANFNMGSTK